MMRFPTFRAFFASIAYYAAHFLTLVRIIWLPMLLLMAASAYLTPQMVDAQLDLASAGNNADPAEAFQMMAPMLRNLGLLYLASAILYPMMTAGVLRHVVRGDAPRLPFYFQFGLDELRVLGAFVLIMVMVALVYIAAVLAFVLVIAILSTASSAAGGIAMAALVLASVGAAIWFSVRLSVTFPAAIGSRSVGIAESWRLTDGNFWGLFFYWVFWMIVIGIVAAIYFAVAFSELWSLFGQMMGSVGDAEAQADFERRMLEAQRDMWDASKPGFWTYMLATYVYGVVITGFWNAAGGVAYRYLSDET